MNQVKIYNKISDVDKKCWDKLTGNNIFMCYDWLKLNEEIIYKPSLPYYITLVSDNEIIAASVCYMEKKNEYSRSIDYSLLGRLINVFLIKKISFLPALVCGSKRGYGAHFLFSQNILGKEIKNIQEQLIDIIENIALKENVPVCFSNVVNNELPLKQILLKRGYLRTKNWPVNFISIKWFTFDEYKAYLKNKFPKMNRKIAYEINRNRKSGVVIKEIENTENEWQQLYNLVEMNHKKHNRSLFPLKPDYFINIKNIFGRNASVYTAVKDKKTIAVCAEVRRDKEADVTLVGVDHEKSGNDFTYFNITYYEPIKNAIESGIEKIYYGNGLYKAKAKRGFSAEDTFLFYKPINRSNYLIRIWFYIHNLWMTRKFSFVKKYD